jgi:LysM repeat protein
MEYKPNYDSYKKGRRRRRRVMGPLVTGGLAIVFIAVGAALMYVWLQGTGIELSFLNTATPTFTLSPTDPPPADTPTITLTPTETLIPSETPTMTASAPFVYLVQSGDTLVSISEVFGVDYLTIMALNGMTNDSILFVGDQLTIPNPGMEFPTPTPLPPNLGRGAKIQYFVMPGDSIKIIAEKLLSTIEDIIDENDLENPDAIFPGQILIVPYRMITPTFGPSPTPEGFIPTDTPTPTSAETSTATATP